jgi:hypothetical protein
MKSIEFIFIIAVAISCNSRKSEKNVNTDTSKNDVSISENVSISKNISESIRMLIGDEIKKGFKVSDSVALKINHDATGYLCLVFPEDENEDDGYGILFALKHENNKLTISDINRNITEYSAHSYFLTENKAVSLTLDYPRAIDQYYFHFELDGVFVDSLTLQGKEFKTDSLIVKTARIISPPFGTIRLKDYSDDILNDLKIHWHIERHPF